MCLQARAKQKSFQASPPGEVEFMNENCSSASSAVIGLADARI